MINAQNYMTAFDDAGVSPYSDTPLKIETQVDGERVQVLDVSAVRHDPELNAVVLVVDISNDETNTSGLAPGANTYSEGSPDTQPAEVRDDAFTPPQQPDQVPASGGSGQVSSDTGSAPRTKW